MVGVVDIIGTVSNRRGKKNRYAVFGQFIYYFLAPIAVKISAHKACIRYLCMGQKNGEE